jgi:hypothetical protein
MIFVRCEILACGSDYIFIFYVTERVNRNADAD